MNLIRNRVASAQNGESEANVLAQYPLVNDFMRKWSSRSPITADRFPKRSTRSSVKNGGEKPESPTAAHSSMQPQQPLPTDATHWSPVVGNPVS